MKGTPLESSFDTRPSGLNCAQLTESAMVMPLLLIAQALAMARTLDTEKAGKLVNIVQKLRVTASFRNIMIEAASEGVLRRHETLRRYLDLLVKGGVLDVRLRDVGSVNPQQLYTVRSERPNIMVGLAVLQRHGLNWDVPETEMRKVSTDFEGLVRSEAYDRGLMASLEDSLVHEIYKDAKKSSGALSLVVAMLATRKLDLPYVLKRADEMHVGQALRQMFRRILETTSSKETEVRASTFFAVRTHFLNIARQYAQSGFWKLVESKGVGQLGLQIADSLNDYDIIMTAGKQLGVTG
jgi:hypothetical protein